jgi:tetratricopeptide (TPR) repeat protein
MLELPERRLRSWEKQGLAPRPEKYTFADLAVLRTLERLRKSGVSSRRIRRVVSALHQRLRSVSDPLRELRIFSEGGRLRVQWGESKMDPVSGQLLLDFDPAALHRVASFPRHTAGDAARAAIAARRFEASLLFEEALKMESRGAPARDVIEVYEKAVALDPASAGALVNLGTVHFHLREWDQAERFYRRALEADPKYALAHFNLGNLFDEQNDRTQACLHYGLALRLEPDYSDAHYNLALLCQSSGQVMRALRHWKAYLRLDSSSPWAEIARQELDKLRRATVIEGAKDPRGEAGAQA